MVPILISDCRKQIRIKHYDYRTPNYYHVVINTKDRQFFFGNMERKTMHYSVVGKIAQDFWKKIPDHFDNVELDVFQVMPNHIHGIIHIINVAPQNAGHGVHNCEPLQQKDIKIGEGEHKFQHTLSKSISTIVRAYKTAFKTWCNQNNHQFFEWQRNFWEHVIRSEKELYAQRTYILNNPPKWQYDRNNPARKPGKYFFEL